MLPEQERIKHIRKVLGLSQKEIADGIGLARAYWSAIETGRRKLTSTIAKKLATQYNVSSDWLLNGSGEPLVLASSKMDHGIKERVSKIESLYENLIRIIELDEMSFGPDVQYDTYLDSVRTKKAQLVNMESSSLSFDQKAKMIHELNDAITKMEKDFEYLFEQYFLDRTHPRRRERFKLPMNFVPISS